MGKLPAVIIIARHGARLDQADKSWHLTSPTPYDPPLTYGGWTQSRALGARIASLLQAREESSHAASKSHGFSGNEEGKHHRSKRRRHKVIIHSSPFLRCLQTSIAISAGMGQFYKAGGVENHPQRHLHSGSPHVYHLEQSPVLSAIPEPDEDRSRNLHKKHPHHETFKKNHLCVDAYLGEWLSPDYFENITPPPSSNMMVASAKAELLRHAEPLDSDSTSRLGSGHFPGGWGSSGNSSIAESEDEVEEGGLAHMAALGHALPRKVRSSTHDSLSSTARLHPKTAKSNISSPTEKPAYMPPVPSYAISPSDAIPTGYVAHARDACVEVELRWDSMREPQNWGDGGDYGEEWSTMHKRFRNGLQNMIHWYRDNDTSNVSHENGTCKDKLSSSSADHDDDADIVLILVTHGAGCNALIGALTNQPVLLDVGMASLTMAVRRDIIDPTSADNQSSPETPSARPTSLAQPRGRTSSIDHSIISAYDVCLVASTEHLRAGSNPLVVPQLQTIVPPTSSAATSSPLFMPARRFGSQSSRSDVSFESFSIGDPAHGINRPVGSLHRSSSAAAATRSYSHHSQPTIRVPTRTSSGLWGSPVISKQPSVDEQMSETSSEDQLPNFSGAYSSRVSFTDTPLTAVTFNSAAIRQNSDSKALVSDRRPSMGSEGLSPTQATTSPAGQTKGLWGSGSVTAVNDRDAGLKRRWTVNEQH